MNEISRKELEQFKKQYHVDYSIGDLTPTVCELMGIPAPDSCGGTPIPPVVDHAAKLFGDDGKTQKVFIFCPDAVGEKHRKLYPELLQRVQDLAGFRCLSSGVMPSVTPVCFGTIFSGASPEVHGIHQWAQPILEIETFFDVASKAGKKVVIIAKNGCSMEKIFRKRNIDYITTRDDETTRKLTQMILENDDYDVVVSYTYNHDHQAHVCGPDSKEAVRALTDSVESFEYLTAIVDKVWGNYNRAAIWAPDHGNHPIDATHGGHGDNIPEDMLVNHFYRIRCAGEK